MRPRNHMTFALKREILKRMRPFNPCILLIKYEQVTMLNLQKRYY